jgi:hypothetical protein
MTVISQHLEICDDVLLGLIDSLKVLELKYAFTPLKKVFFAFVGLMTAHALLNMGLPLLQLPTDFLQFIQPVVTEPLIQMLYGVTGLFLVFDFLSFFIKKKTTKPIKIDLRSYVLDFDLCLENAYLHTVSYNVFKGATVIPFSAFSHCINVSNFILLQQQQGVGPEWIFLKKDAITHADFQRLKEVIPCLQGLSVDPQQFKQELHTHES